MLLYVTALQYGDQLFLLLWSQCFGEDSAVFWGGMSYNMVHIYYGCFKRACCLHCQGFICSTFQKTVLFIVTAITSNLIYAVAVTVKECKHLFFPVLEPKFTLG
jgi:hypothetical protein